MISIGMMICRWWF